MKTHAENFYSTTSWGVHSWHRWAQTNTIVLACESNMVPRDTSSKILYKEYALMYYIGSTEMENQVYAFSQFTCAQMSVTSRIWQ